MRACETDIDVVPIHDLLRGKGVRESNGICVLRVAPRAMGGFVSGDVIVALIVQCASLCASLVIALCIFLLTPGRAQATTCTTAGSVVNCTGAANPLAPNYANTTSGITVNADSTTNFGVLLGVGGTAVSLTGSNVTFNNSGTIDPSLLGILSILSSGTVIGNSSASTINVTNNGTMNGTAQLVTVNLSNLTGLALAVQNGAGGVSNIVNNGTIGSSAIAGVTVAPADRVTAAVYGGGQVNFTNNGTISGRVGFQASTAGNTFRNTGSVIGSVSMGAGSTNNFYAYTGSSVSAGTGAYVGVLGLVGVNLGFAQAGYVDGGSGGNNTLHLAQATGGPAAGQVTMSNYINFNHLSLESGTWTLNGPSGALDATLASTATAIVDNATSLGTGTITATGGALEAAAAGLNIANTISLGTGGLIAQGSNAFTLSGVLSGTGALTKTGTAALTLTGANTYSGGTNLNGGSLVAGNAAALGSGALNVGGAATLDTSTAGLTLGNAVNLGANTLTLGGSNAATLSGVIAGTGALVKSGAATVTLTGVNTYTGGT